jgi:hypothetical protein
MTRLRFAFAWAGLLLCGLPLARPAVSAPAEARKPTPVAYLVVCDEPQVRDKLSRRIGELLRAEPGYVVRDHVPGSQLIVYANRDVNDRVNPNGYSIAIAHVSNMEAFFLAKRLFVDKPTDDERAKEVVAGMIREQGMLSHLNVAHMDEATDREIDLVSRTIVAGFLERTPANAGP